MVNFKISLKEESSGFTLVELIITLSILGVILMWMLLSFKPLTQICKAKDARRKADLNKIQNVLEDYYNDHNCYPPSFICKESFKPYFSEIPCDPDGGSYGYSVAEGCSQWYRLYAKLCYKEDPDIVKVGCRTGCGPAGTSDYNYGVASTNVALEIGSEELPTLTTVPLPTSTSAPAFSPTPTQVIVPSPTTPPAVPTPTSPPPTSGPVGEYYGCIGGVCQSLSGPVCSPNYNYSNCLNRCHIDVCQ